MFIPGMFLCNTLLALNPVDIEISNGGVYSMNGFPYWSLVLVWIFLGTVIILAAAVQLRTVYLTGMIEFSCFSTNLPGKLPRLLLGYAIIIFSAILFFLIEFKHYKFHLHHFQIGLLFWPGTVYKTRFSMLFQSVLFGIFLNGALFWGMEASLYDNVGMLNFLVLFIVNTIGVSPTLLPNITNFNASYLNSTLVQLVLIAS
jgi:hypothetical protein